VYGHIKVIPEALRRDWSGHDQVDLTNSRHKGIGYHEQTQSLMTCSFDADHAPVHVHHLCLDDAGKPVSRDEKLRRLAALGVTSVTPDEDRAYTIDGYRRMMALAKIGAP